MSELRLNPITKEWVIVFKDRAKRPEELRQRSDRRHPPSYDSSCPFCPGNEEKTPNEIARISSDGQWKIRVVPNKYPALSTTQERVRHNEGLRHTMMGAGRHEIIIEHPRHDIPMAMIEPEWVKSIMGVYRDRFNDAFGDSRIHNVILFKNHGTASGTTIAHSHSQLIGVPLIPFSVRQRIEEAMRYFDTMGECLMCGVLRDELGDGSRIIMNSEHFVSFIPYAALSPFHTWIFPKRHAASFGDISEVEIADLANTLSGTLARLYYGLDDPDFNFIFITASPYRKLSEYLHWYISIVPRVMSSTGFELGSGMHVNHCVPEEVAEFLRNVRVS